MPLILIRIERCLGLVHGIKCCVNRNRSNSLDKHLGNYLRHHKMKA
jgi:hypothetical protein